MGFGFETLDAWKRSIAFADQLFQLADGLPRQYQFSLGEQLRRAALSIPSNIAEGSGRDSGRARAAFYRIAKGSLYETVSLLVMLGKRKLLAGDQYRIHYREADEIASMLTALIHFELKNSSS
jgi:four helix bundle protein